MAGAGEKHQNLLAATARAFLWGSPLSELCDFWAYLGVTLFKEATSLSRQGFDSTRRAATGHSRCFQVLESFLVTNTQCTTER